MTMVSRGTRRVHSRDRKYGDDENKVACVCNRPNQSQQGKGKERKKAKDVEKERQTVVARISTGLKLHAAAAATTP